MLEKMNKVTICKYSEMKHRRGTDRETKTEVTVLDWRGIDRETKTKLTVLAQEMDRQGDKDRTGSVGLERDRQAEGGQMKNTKAVT